ncbi:MAG: GNAT family N-acetyltransferase [Promethearchaeota archaeon]
MSNVNIVEEINIENLFLKKISTTDAHFFLESLKEKKLILYLAIGPLLNLAHSKKLIKNYLKYWNKKNQFNYVIEIRNGKNKIKVGSISLWNVSWLHKRAEIGIWLIPNYWDKGIGKKAMTLIKNIAFNHLKLNRLEAHISIENIKSITLFKKCGFSLEGTLKQYLYLNGKHHDALILSYLKDT